MTDTPLPPNVYRLPQKDFSIIPGDPWTYALSSSVRVAFKNLNSLGNSADIVLGMKTSDNFRFVRYWWEINRTASNWKIYEKHVSGYKYYYPSHAVVLWDKDSIAYYKDHYSAQLPNPKYWMQPGVNFSSVSAKRFTTKLLIGGRMCDMAANTIFPHDMSPKNLLSLLGILNSTLSQYFLKILNPTVNFQVVDVKRIPYFVESSNNVANLVLTTVRMLILRSGNLEETYDFNVPNSWNGGLEDLARAETCFQLRESQIDDEVFTLYGISPADRSAIETELSGGTLNEDSSDDDEQKLDDEEETSVASITPQKLAVRWISYAVGVALGRFQPGVAGALGSAIYHCSDFTIGSLPAPDEAEFDELVGSPEHFAYIDSQGGRHVFSVQVEKALQALALPDGIAVLDEGHPRDLVKLTTRALELLLGEAHAREVIQTGANSDLRKFLEKDFFTAWHLKWYRKRPVYWPIQSNKRSYGFVIFHEKITRETFYTIQREPYLDTKRNAVALKIADLQSALRRATGAGRKKIEKDLDELQKLADELAAFAKDLETITLGGFEPEANWIDDGVILRMAPLAKVLPIWKSEPKKYWERLEAGDFDWSHIAMKYWPDRVRQKCKLNKSYAIAHGHEEWYQG